MLLSRPACCQWIYFSALLLFGFGLNRRHAAFHDVACKTRLSVTWLLDSRFLLLSGGALCNAACLTSQQRSDNLTWGLNVGQKLHKTLQHLHRIRTELKSTSLCLPKCSGLIKKICTSLIIIHRSTGAQKNICVCIPVFALTYLCVSCCMQFLEGMQLNYNSQAAEKGVYIIGSCGFDSIPADMGVIYTRDQFKGMHALTCTHTLI